MSLIYVGKNGRTYERRFDHDEARRLRDEGWTYGALGKRYGVDASAVWQAVNDYNRWPEVVERHNQWMRDNNRELCKGGCGRLVWTLHRDRSGMCPECSGKARSVTARPGELRCSHCKKWKPDDRFPLARQRRGARRGRHSTCRACQAEVRQATRERRKVPCIECGAPCLPPAEKGLRRGDSGLCRNCWLDAQRGRRGGKFKPAGRDAA